MRLAVGLGLASLHVCKEGCTLRVLHAGTHIVVFGCPKRLPAATVFTEDFTVLDVIELAGQQVAKVIAHKPSNA